MREAQHAGKKGLPNSANSIVESCRSFFPGFDGTIPDSPATAETPADGAGEVVSGSCGCVDGYIPERNEDSELVKCRCAIWDQCQNLN